MLSPEELLDSAAKALQAQVSAKRWEGTVGRPEIMKLVGALAGQRASIGVFISTSTYTHEAPDYAAQASTRWC